VEKRCVREVAEHVMDRPDMEGLRVRDVIDRHGCGSKGVVLHFGEIPAGKEHQLHRHPNSEEAMYVLKGSGVCTGEGGASVPVAEGDAVYIRQGEWHGVRNDSDRPLNLLVVLGGVGSYEDAGYELLTAGAGQQPPTGSRTA